MTPREDGVTDGRRPDGNRAEVEVVSTSDLLPGNVVWCEDGWYAVLDSDQNDSTQVSAAQIIDDAGGQDEDGLLYGEWFLRLAHPAATEREEAWKAMVAYIECEDAYKNASKSNDWMAPLTAAGWDGKSNPRPLINRLRTRALALARSTGGT